MALLEAPLVQDELIVPAIIVQAQAIVGASSPLLLPVQAYSAPACDAHAFRPQRSFDAILLQQRSTSNRK